MFKDRQPAHDSSPEEIAFIKAVNAFEKQQVLEDLRWVLSTKQGRRFVWHMLGLFQIYSVKETTTRSVGLQFLDYLCDNFSEEYLSVQREQMQANNAYIAQLRKFRASQERQLADPRRAGQAGSGAKG